MGATFLNPNKHVPGDLFIVTSFERYCEDGTRLVKGDILMLAEYTKDKLGTVKMILLHRGGITQSYLGRLGENFWIDYVKYPDCIK